MATIGPISCNENDVKKFSGHTKLFRLNGSHSSIEWHAKAISLIRSLIPEAFILLDIPGIKPRTSNEQAIEITSGQVVTFASPNSVSPDNCVYLTKALPNYPEDLQSFSINDGQYIFDVTNTRGSTITGRSLESFILNPKKGINIPGSIYDEKLQFEIYNAFISKIEHLEIDALGLSFVQTGALVEKIKKQVPNLLMISKIENSEGLRNCKEIAAASDAVMIDRGDLVAEIGYDKLFSSIEEIAKATKTHGKPLIMATENLETMVRRQMPSKSEVISLAHSAQIGVDCFMLSEETALSENRHIIVSWLTKFLESSLIERRRYQANPAKTNEEFSIWGAITADETRPIIVMSKSGRAIFKLFAKGHTADVFVISNNMKVKKMCQLFSNNVETILIKFNALPTIDILRETIDQNADIIFEKNDKVMAIYVSKYTKSPRVNTMTIFSKSDFK
ncbi:pyruvate kinase [Planktomarina temperata]|nr:pyruvate kinase [Planktomarina temperata]